MARTKRSRRTYGAGEWGRNRRASTGELWARWLQYPAPTPTAFPTVPRATHEFHSRRGATAEKLSKDLLKTAISATFSRGFGSRF